MLNIKNCTFNYKRKGVPTIDNFSLRLEEGGVYGLLGSNGVGKSTLLQLICGLLTPDSGEVTLNGINTRLRRPSTLDQIFLVPEEIGLPALKLDTFISLNGAFYPNFSKEDMYRHLDTFGLDTKILLMDEQTNGLDIPAKSAFRKFIIESMSDDRIFVISTHQVRDVSQILDHILIMDKSKVLIDRTVNEIQDKLKFLDTTDASLIEKAVYAAKGLGGASIILPNDQGDDSELNLELLFDFAVTDPERLNSIFKS